MDISVSISMALAFMAVWVVLFGAVCSSIWSNKGGDGFVGFLIGATLGVLGLIVVLALNPEGSLAPDKLTRECPFCKERMRRDASVCPHCQRDSEPWVFHDGFWWARRDGTDHFYDEGRNEWVRFDATKLPTS